jgi:toxin ParE1/3/4
MNVVFTDEAKADLADIAFTIAKTNPLRARRVYRDLRQRCEGLADMPLRFQLVPRFERFGIRRRVAGDYLIFYRVRDAVEILHVFHGAMNYAPHLGREH